MCDPVVDWDNNTVQHNDMRPMYDYTKQLLTEAEDIKEKESKYQVLGKLVRKSVKQNIGLKNLVEADLADREHWTEYRKAKREWHEFLDKIGRRASRREKIKTYMNKKQKILTIVALVAFAAIIALHYTEFHSEQYYGVGPYHREIRLAQYNYTHKAYREALIPYVQMPLFVLAVFYTGLFFLLAKKR